MQCNCFKAFPTRFEFLARLFSRKMSRYYHSTGVVGGGVVVAVRKLCFFLISLGVSGGAMVLGKGVLLVWLIVGQGATALAAGAGGGCLDIFSVVYHFTFLSPSLWETAQYRLKYCLKGPLSPKQPNNQSYISAITEDIYLKLILAVHYQKGNLYK